MEKASWETVASNRCLCPVACELLCAYLVDDGAGNADCALHDGDSGSAKRITYMRALQHTIGRFQPPEPVRCNSGIYVACGTNVGSVFVQWRRISQK